MSCFSLTLDKDFVIIKCIVICYFGLFIKRSEGGIKLTDTKTLAYINMYASSELSKISVSLTTRQRRYYPDLKSRYPFVSMLSTDRLQQSNLQRAAAVWKTE